MATPFDSRPDSIPDSSHDSQSGRGCTRLLQAVFAVAALWSGCAAAQWKVSGDPVPELTAFDNAMHTIMTDHGMTAGQLAVTWQGRLVLAHGYTLNPGPGDVTVQPSSLMRIASLSKQITSILVNRLIEDGQLSPTDTLNEFVDLTPLEGQTMDSRMPNITVRNLLEHTAGFRNFGIRDPMFADPQIADAVGTGLPISQADVILAMNGVPLGSDPGTQSVYSNYGYLLLGRIIEAASGMSYEAYARSVFEPIGVWKMRLGRSELANRAPGEVHYFSGWTNPTVMNNSGATVPYEYGGFNLENMDSHGGWIASAVEMVRIASNLDNPAAADAVLNQTSVNRMFSLPTSYPPPYNPGNVYYAQGWQVIDFGSAHFNTWHGGSLPGTSSYIVRTWQGWDYVVNLNRRDETGQIGIQGVIDNAMWNVRGQIADSEWPTHDLFPKMLSVIFTSGFD